MAAAVAEAATTAPRRDRAGFYRRRELRDAPLSAVHQSRDFLTDSADWLAAGPELDPSWDPSWTRAGPELDPSWTRAVTAMRPRRDRLPRCGCAGLSALQCRRRWSGRWVLFRPAVIWFVGRVVLTVPLVSRSRLPRRERVWHCFRQG